MKELRNKLLYEGERKAEEYIEHKLNQKIDGHYHSTIFIVCQGPSQVIKSINGYIVHSLANEVIDHLGVEFYDTYIWITISEQLLLKP